MNEFENKQDSKHPNPGQPTKYHKQYDKLAYKFCLLGATDKQLADLFEVSVDTIHEWKKVHSSFLASIKKGKASADAKVAESLFRRATGYSHPETDIKVIDGRIVKSRVVKNYAPDTTAAIFWLKNRDKENWRDKQLIDINYDNLSEDHLDRIIHELKKAAHK